MTEWFTLEELSRYLKVSRASLYKMAQEGRIPASKMGRGWRFERERIDAWLRESEKKSSSLIPEFPWSDCLEVFLKSLHKKFGSRFSSLWIYGSWARGEATQDSDVDLLVVLQSRDRFAKDFESVRQLAYQATFGRDRLIVFSTTLVDQETFVSGMEPLLLNVRKEGRKAA